MLGGWKMDVVVLGMLMVARDIVKAGHNRTPSNGTLTVSEGS